MCPSRESDEHWRRERCKQRFLHTQKKVLSILLVLHSNVSALIQKCNLDIWTSSIRACVGKKRCCFFSLSIHKRLIPVLPSTLPAVQHLTGANVETKTCTLGFFFFTRGATSSWMPTSGTVCVCWLCKWMSCTSSHFSSLRSQVIQHSFTLTSTVGWWGVLNCFVVFFIPGELIAEFHGGVLWGC